MKSEKNVLVAFILNLLFAVFEIIGGIFTGSVAILSDAVHDMGDAVSIGLSVFLEKKSRRPPDEHYTYGYAGYSLLGSALTLLILLLGSVAVILQALMRLWNPVDIHYDGMIFWAITGFLINLIAAFLTRKGDSLHQKTVNLHMLEDTLGWCAVLVGAVMMCLTGWSIIDPLLSIAIAVFIFISAFRRMSEIMGIFLGKVPHGMKPSELQERLCALDGVLDVHHLHIWGQGDRHICATLHLIVNGDPCKIKSDVRMSLAEYGIDHVTIELESEEEDYPSRDCTLTDTATDIHRSDHHHYH